MRVPELETLVERLRVLFDAFEDGGHVLYLVGGCVRDALLGGHEQPDIDLTTDAHPDRIAELLAAQGLRVVTIGARFGTIATWVQGVEVEITTFRSAEHYAAGSRKPEVEFGSELDEDLSRRDLSINAMAADRSGSVIDRFGGIHALRERRLEVPGGGFENTLSILRDDPLRLLRIARFAARLDFRPSPETTRAAQASAESLREISRERWKMEMDKLLVARHVPRGLDWLAEVGALTVILPELRHAVELGQMQRIGRQISGVGEDAISGWALLLVHATWHEIEGAKRLTWRAREARRRTHREAATEVVTRVASRFRFSREEERRLLRLVTWVPAEGLLRSPWDRPRCRRHLIERGDEAIACLDLQLVLADDVADLEEPVAERQRELAELARNEDPTPRLPTGLGRVVIDHFALPSGPVVARALRALQEAILDEALSNDPTPEACLAWLRANPAWRQPEATREDVSS